MLIQKDYVCKNGVVLTHSYSDAKFFIKQLETGELYAEAYDIPNKFTYEETDEAIEDQDE